MHLSLTSMLVLFGCAACQGAAPASAPPAAPAPPPASSAPLQDKRAELAPPTAPAAIAVPGQQQVRLKLRGKGVQIYGCRAKPGAGEAFEWALVAPEAELFDDAGKAVLKHSAGPTWESTDGSRVVGKLEAKADAPEATAIPWLLLSAKPSGTGMLSHVSYVQRVDTQGGKAAPAGCDALHADAEQRVEYSATYYFYEPQSE